MNIVSCTNNLEKIGFLRRLKIAIIDLEDYLLFIPEKFRKAAGFVFKMSLILAIILTGFEIGNIIVKYGSLRKFNRQRDSRLYLY